MFISNSNVIVIVKYIREKRRRKNLITIRLVGKVLETLIIKVIAIIVVHCWARSGMQFFSGLVIFIVIVIVGVLVLGKVIEMKNINCKSNSIRVSYRISCQLKNSALARTTFATNSNSNSNSISRSNSEANLAPCICWSWLM